MTFTTFISPRTHKQEIPPYELHCILYMRISSSRKHNLSHPSHKHHNLWNLTTTRTFIITTRWGDYATTTSILHCHTKRHNPTESCLFYFLSQDVFTEIDFLASWIEHCDKHKAVITKIHPLLNPILFSITQELWAPYHNFGVYGSWYNECCYI